MERINLHLYQSKFTHESRILRETLSITQTELFDKIIIAAVWDQGLRELESLDARREVWRVPLSARKWPGGNLWKAVQLLNWQMKVFHRLKDRNVTCVNCHSLVTLPLGVLFKVKKDTRLIYDPHELETETHKSSGARKRVSKILEKIFIRYADAVIVVSNSIGRWYRETYGLRRVQVVRNMPDKGQGLPRPSQWLRTNLGIPEEDLIFLYVGGLSAGRGIELLLKVFAQCELNKHLLFMGFGKLEGAVREYADRYPNIHFHPPVKPKEVITYASGADVGFSLNENTCLSHYYSVPNKIFEYLLAGVPVIASDFPDTRQVLEEFHCGWPVKLQIEELAALVGSLKREDILGKKGKLATHLDRIGWENEAEKLLQVYDSLDLPAGAKSS